MYGCVAVWPLFNLFKELYYICIHIHIYIGYIFVIRVRLYCTMGPGPGLVAHVLWRYCMRLSSSGVGGVQRVRLALLYVGSCVGVLWMMFWMRLASSGVGGVHRVPSEG